MVLAAKFSGILTFLSFSPSSIKIALAFLSCFLSSSLRTEVFWDFNLLVIFTVEYKDCVSFSFLFSFFFVKNQIASFFDSSKLLCFRRVRVYILAYFIA